jgi:arginine exporter protein ArgO
MKTKSVAAALLLFAVMGTMILLHAPPGAIMTARYLGVAALVVYAWTKRSNAGEPGTIKYDGKALI